METTFTIFPATSPDEHTDVGTRLDRFVAARMPGVSRTRLQDAIETGSILVNDKVKTSHYALRAGDVIRIGEIAAPAAPTVSARHDIPLDIIFEDPEVIVINKPTGLIVHPAVSEDTESVTHALMAHYPAIATVGESELRPGIVHRLDKEASGLLVAAKNERAYEALKDQFQAHTIEKEYVILVEGAPPHDTGTIRLAIGRKSHSGRMSARPEAREGDREAVTHYAVMERFEDLSGKPIFSLLRITTETGRTHQIRVHMKAIGCPISGDPLYGSGSTSTRTAPPAPVPFRGQHISSPRLFLHAAKLGFDHPVSGKRMVFEVELPGDLAAVVEKLRRLRGE